MEDRSESSLIPLDLAIEILLRLPTKSIGRFRCVSKLWLSMTTSPHFVKSFALRSTARPCLLSVKKDEDKDRVLVYSLPHHHHDVHGDPQTRVGKYQMMLPKEATCLPLDTQAESFMGNFDTPQSVHGLISFGKYESVIIWNPTLRQHVTLPDPDKVSKPLISLLGYDPVGGEYKVLSMSLCEDARRNGEEAQIFTLGAQETWRSIHNSPSLIHGSIKSWKCIKGVVYYFSVDATVVSFDVRSENFQVIQIPEMLRILLLAPPLFDVGMGVGFISHMGKLAWFINYGSLLLISELRLWVLEDAEKHEWVQLRESILPFETAKLEWWNGRRICCYLFVSGETADGELIYLPTSSEGPLYAIYYHLKKGSVRKVEYDGIHDKTFRFDCFPHHIDSLLSLKNLLPCA